MSLLSILLFVISSSSDNLIVGLSYGAKRVKINAISNFMISFISGFGTFLAMLFGKMFIKIISLKCSDRIGSGILICFGIYLLFHWLKNIKCNRKTEEYDCVPEYNRYDSTLRNPEIIDTNHSKTIEIKEAVILGLVLCLNNICLGIGAGITGVNIYITSIASFVFSLLFLPAGYYLGRNIFSERLSGYSEIISICLIIILGIYELFI